MNQTKARIPVSTECEDCHGMCKIYGPRGTHLCARCDGSGWVKSYVYTTLEEIHAAIVTLAAQSPRKS